MPTKNSKTLLTESITCAVTATAFVIAGCSQNQNAKLHEKSTWKSAHHPIQVTFDEPWNLIPNHIDSPEKVLVGFIDSRDGKSYLIKMTDDVAASELSNEEYVAAIKNEMLSAHSENRLIDEGNVTFHGRDFDRLRFSMHTEKWGTLHHIAYFSRSGGKFVGVQMAFPYGNQSEEASQIPDEINILDRGVCLFDTEHHDKE